MLRRYRPTFNSLSLGITKDFIGEDWKILSIFQFPLSGSLSPYTALASLATAVFQFPLSGSQDGDLAEGHADRPGRLSIPSLGITSERACQRRRASAQAFNSLSRDHRFGLFRQALGEEQNFQFPLSGSPQTNYNLAKQREAELSFNSLSRDHRARFRDFSALRGFLPRHLFAQMISEATIWIYRFAPL